MSDDETNCFTLINDAWEHLEVGQPAAAAALVRQVLAAQPDVIDAYVVLAQTRVVPAEAIALLREGVDVGDRLRKAAGNAASSPQDLYDGPAYVRALGNLPRLLWADGRADRRGEALRYARRAFRLDPYDRAGTRLLLMAWEAAVGNWPAARRVVRRCHDEGRTEVRYWLALHAFRDGTTDADALLGRAIETNPHVAVALQGRLVALRLPEASYPFGSPEEASIYAADARDGWQATPGAMAWLAAAAAAG